MIKNKSVSKTAITYALCFFVPILIAVGVSVLLGFYPFGESSILTGDLHGTYLAYMSGYRDMLLEGKSLFFSFSKQLGGSLFNFFIPYLFTPLNYIYVLSPVTAFPAVALFIWFFRIGLSGLSAAFALKYFNRSITDGNVFRLSVCYSLLGYAVAYNQINDWHFFIVALPVLCVLTERFIVKGKFLLYALALFFTVMHFYYLAYMVCIFLGIFFFYRLFLFSQTVEKEKRRRFFLSRTGGFVGVSLLSVLMCCFYLIPTVIGASADKGGLFKISTEKLFNYNPLTLISKFFVGSYAWNNIIDGLPIVYCGLICLPLLLLYFQNKNIARREKLASAAVLTLYFIVTELEPLNIFFHGGSPPTWFPFRYSFVICFFIVFLAARSACVPFAFSKKRLIINGAVLFVLATTAYFFTENIPSAKRIALSLILLVLYLVFFYLKFGEKSKPVFSLIISLAVVFELFLNTYFTMSVYEYYNYEEFCSFITTNSASLDKAEAADEGFYRIDKTYNRTYNDSFWLNYYGNSLFSSQADITQRLSIQLGYGANIYARGSTAFSDSLLSFKYLLADDENTVPSHYDIYDSSLAHPLYKSRYTLPLCFLCDDGAALIDTTAYDNTFIMQNDMLRSLTGEAADFFAPLTETERTFDANTNSGSITFVAESDLFAYGKLVTNASGGVELSVNGRPLGKYGDADFNSVINLGEFKSGDSIVLSYDFYDESAVITSEAFYGLDTAAFNKAFDMLNSGAPSESSISDGHAALTVNARDGQMLFTSLLYSPYWNITVNGEKVDGEAVFGALLGVPLESGENEIVIHYVPPMFCISLCISIVSAGALAAVYFTDRKKHSASIKA